MNGAGAGAGAMRPNTGRPTTCGGGRRAGGMVPYGWPTTLSRCGVTVAPIPIMGAVRAWLLENTMADLDVGWPIVKDWRGTAVTA